MNSKVLYKGEEWEYLETVHNGILLSNGHDAVLVRTKELHLVATIEKSPKVQG